MLNEKEELFLKYWEANRQRQKKLIYQLIIGLPAGLAFAAAIMCNFRSEWYKRADMMINSNSNPIIILTALLIIVIFVAIFSKKFQWDQREQRYLELMAKKNKPNYSTPHQIANT